MDAIIRFDTELFRIVNLRLTAPLLDAFMPYVTEKFNFLGVVIVAVLLIVAMGDKKDRWGLVVLVAVVATSDFTSNLLKHVFMRTRPCNALDGVRLLSGCGASYSLPSGHATNIFAAMVFLTTRYRRFFSLFLSIAFVVAYSRVYVGVHYPLDAASGAVLGSAIALFYAQADKRLAVYYKNRRGSLEA